MLQSGSLGKIARSLSVKMAVIFVVLTAVPVLIYTLLQKADDQKNALVLRAIQQEGRLTAATLFPSLENFSPGIAEQLQGILDRTASEGSTIKILFRAKDQGDPEGFLFVAAHPRLSPDTVAREQAEIINTGLLERVTDACEKTYPLALQFRNAAGEEEILTYMGTHKAEAGCWAVITSIKRSTLLGTASTRPYWQTAEIGWAAAIYATMAVLILSIFISLRKNVRRFEDVITIIRNGYGDKVSFKSRNAIPELSGVAGKFDELVEALRRSERQIRESAEENAHAFKAPLAVISQSLEPLRRCVTNPTGPAARSLDRIEQSIERLDGLITTARRIDESTPALIDQPMEVVNLHDRILPIVNAYFPLADMQNVNLRTRIGEGIYARANPELFENAFENVLTNAIDYAPPGSSIDVSVEDAPGKRIRVSVTDHGPGAPEEDMERIFDRYFSTRRSEGHDGNFGIGLWITRRNMEAMGGSASARNSPHGGGLTVTLELPKEE